MMLLRNTLLASIAFAWATVLPAVALAQPDAASEPMRVPSEPRAFWAALLTLAGLQLCRSIRYMWRHP